MTSNHPKLTQLNHSEIIANLCEKLQAFHVFPEVADRLALGALA
jgi:hypothetical protein